MFERPRSGERALLVYVFSSGAFQESECNELRELALSAGAEVAGLVKAGRSVADPRFFVGAGKLAEIRELAAEKQAELVIFNAALSPAQERNLEQALKCRVLDRIGLILDLFAQRAKTFEGKLQVELAQLRHISTRLVRGWTHLERQKGGIGLRGPGETQLETDRRLVAERIRRIVQRLEKVSQRRELSRRARRRAQTPVISLVGYTNAGKSSLFNRLTGAGVLAEDRLFATLDPTLRKFVGPTGAKFLLVDTVGFVGNLPHALVAAFKSTLEETIQASLLLHVVDASTDDWELKIDQVNKVLEEIGAGEVPQLLVFNKVDRLDEPLSCWHSQQPWVGVSALTGTGLADLACAIEKTLTSEDLRLSVRIPFAEGRLRSALFQHTRVLAENVSADAGWILDVEGPVGVIERLRRAHRLDDYVLSAGADVRDDWSRCGVTK